MHAVYMQSVKDHVGPSSGRYKLAYGLNANVNVFSQAPGPEYHQSYEMDTFCVPNDFVEYENSGDDENGDKSETKSETKVRHRPEIVKNVAKFGAENQINWLNVVVWSKNQIRIEFLFFKI